MTTATAQATDVIIELERCQKYFPVTQGIIVRHTIGQVKAVDGISFKLSQGQTYSLVGESGCGKTTTAKMVLQVEKPSGGVIRFNGKNVAEFTAAERKAYRSSVQAVFQDPWSSLNPRMRVGSIVLEPLLANRP
jgi:oligopeptide transport system ATP-binding protein